MNEILEYNPDDYHLNQTHSVYVVLEGTHLRLQRPKTNMPRRALWDEILPPPKFIHQRHLELKSSRIFLMPPGLVKKRVWSKKYPICIALDQEKLPVVKTKSNDSKKSTDDDSDFEIITEDKCSSNILYLFARTGWEKEVWFKRLQAASHGKPLQNHILDIYKALSITSRMSRNPSTSSLKHKRQSSNDSISSISSQPDQPPSPSQTTTSNTTSDDNPVNLQAFAEYMGRLMPSEKELKESATSKSSHFKHDSSDIRQVTGSLVCDPQLIWLNSLVGRCFWDLLQDEWWSEKIREKLQKKLSKIHVPYFIEELKVTHTEMGYEVPSIRRAGKPYIDEQGLWIDLDIVYNGGFYMTMETKINLMKLQKKSDEKLHKDDSGTYHSPVTDSNEEDSAESSTDEDEESQDTANDGFSKQFSFHRSSGGAGKKVLKYIDKIANSKYFQQAYEYKYIKKAMEGVSNTPLELTVELNNLTGRLALNIPPPPTDRLWYGFRGNPILSLSAKPKVGERQVNISHITEWIEKKLSTEFQRVFVMPNMDDLVIPILLPGIPSDVIPDIPHSQSSTAV
ncbi:hypothetical protein LOTGIDRAFT_211163 [Lottia gigantea]|uniref:SMP-LTD domain-containing protein n=1 Tax=Lottia gigantea TaxID=225164 RepID=V3ZNZ2_LOTGI|nr:hypothetical protein LOTGIDRAFT_211163 [Lottia gigantea]ESO84210.1 hypothetical protein LOTGIDRAFT_211163 [Lottia gigantea]